MSLGPDYTDAYEITEDDRRLVTAFRRQPIGQHSPALQRILVKMRGEPIKGKYVLICQEYHKKWALAQMTGNPENPIEIVEERVFSNLEDAEWEVFKRRWKKYTGQDLAE